MSNVLKDCSESIKVGWGANTRLPLNGRFRNQGHTHHSIKRVNRSKSGSRARPKGRRAGRNPEMATVSFGGFGQSKNGHFRVVFVARISVHTVHVRLGIFCKFTVCKNRDLNF